MVVDYRYFYSKNLFCDTKENSNKLLEILTTMSKRILLLHSIKCLYIIFNNLHVY